MSAPPHQSLSLPPLTRTLCFPPTALTARLDIPTFIADLRLRAPLSLIRDDLRHLLEAISAALVTCVQRDFASFIALGPALAPTDALCNATRVPLATLRVDITALVASLDADIAALTSTLAERRDAAARTDALRALLRTNDLLEKCERLLRDYRGLNAVSGEALALVERIAGEGAQMMFALARAGGGKFVRVIGPRVAGVKREIRGALEAWLKRGLVGGVNGVEVLRRVLDAFVVSGLEGEAEGFFRRHVVVGFTGEKVRMATALGVAEKKRAGKASPADALEVVEKEIVAFLEEKVKPLLAICESEERLKTRLDFVGKAVWPQIAKAIASNMQSAFSPGSPDVFHQSVQSGSRIYAAVEGVLLVDAHVAAMRSSATTKDFWRHWNLPVYFQLRFQEIASKYDAELQRGPVAAVGNSAGTKAGSRILRSDMYRTQATVGMVDALRECWSERVYLKPLAHRFMRLSLQILARYVTWVRAGLAGEWSKSESISTGAARVYADIDVLENRLRAEFASLLRMRDVGVSSQLLDEMEVVFDESVAAFSSLLPDLSLSMSDVLSRSCVENLQPLRGILATYRVSSKPAPTAHSPFVPKVLRPLKLFLNEQRGALSEEACMEVSTKVAGTTTAKYYEMATDLLKSNKKSEETLKRLNIGRGGLAGGSASRSGSMTSKVAMQLYLDVAKFKEGVEALGVSLENVPSIARLWECVRRDEDKISGSVGNASQATAPLPPSASGAVPVPAAQVTQTKAPQSVAAEVSLESADAAESVQGEPRAPEGVQEDLT